MDTTHTTSNIEDSAEDLRLLASHCLTSSEDSHPVIQNVSSPEALITIATPVPLPYSVRNTEVLGRMISGSKETYGRSLSLVEKLEMEQTQSVEEVSIVLSLRILAHRS
ncbi:hypothetical protein H0H92_012492 [Tricholoma furcatifolium]|nr:hypothetical protein H0H92_012492 [Tricholoma furcatifolium]